MIQIKVEKTNKTQRIPKEVKEKLKDLGIYSKLQFMKKEIINCPKTGKVQSPIYCFLCEYFARRIKGVIYCKYK